MIVDDNSKMIDYMRRLMESYKDFEITSTARTLEEAREVLARESPDMLFLDVQLPDGDGFELAPFVKQYHPGLYVVMFTAYYDEIKDGAFNLGESDYLLKPVDPMELDKVMRRFKKSRKEDTKSTGAVMPRGKMEGMVALVNVNNELCPRSIGDIAFFRYEGRRKMWTAVLDNNVTMTLRKGTTAKDILLLSDLFQQSHQSFIVNLSLVDTIGNTFVRLHKPFNLYAIPLSRTYQGDFSERFLQI